MKKKQSISSVKKRAWDVFSFFIRLRDCLQTTGSPEWGECITCDETKQFHELDAGHFRPKRNANYFSEKGVHAQCQRCNRYKGGEPLEYRRKIVELYGEGYDEVLEQEARGIKRFSIKELEALMVYFKEQIRRLENEAV